MDPNLDPELALALRVSMEEERARQAAASAAAQQAAGGEGAGAAEGAAASGAGGEGALAPMPAAAAGAVGSVRICQDHGSQQCVVWKQLENGGATSGDFPVKHVEPLWSTVPRQELWG